MTTKEVYVAYDGKEFDNPSNCKKYERYSLKASAGDAFKSIKTLVANSAIANQNCTECPFCNVALICLTNFRLVSGMLKGF